MRIKFVCLNLWEGGILFDAAIEFLRKENADVLALQEVHNSQNSLLEKRWRSVEVIKKELGFEHVDFAPTFISDKAEDRTVRGNAIFSKFPIRSVDTVFFDVPYSDLFIEVPENYSVAPRNLERAVIDANGIELNIFNTQGIWGLDGEDNERRLKMGDAIAESVKDKKNVILAGDFNVKESTQTIHRVEAHLKNVFKGERVTSFNMRRKSNGGYATAVVDMLFASPNIKVLEHTCPEVDVSDHLPLTALFEL